MVGMGALSVFGVGGASSTRLDRTNDDRKPLKDIFPSARCTGDGTGCSVSSGVPNDRIGRASGGVAIDNGFQ